MFPVITKHVEDNDICVHSFFHFETKEVDCKQMKTEVRIELLQQC